MPRKPAHLPRHPDFWIVHDVVGSPLCRSGRLDLFSSQPRPFLFLASPFLHSQQTIDVQAITNHAPWAPNKGVARGKKDEEVKDKRPPQGLTAAPGEIVRQVRDRRHCRRRPTSK